MEGGCVRHLPDGLRVFGSLVLCPTITTLPSRLHVERDLDLGTTAVARLPQDLVVGGEIRPPPSLDDLRAFMAQQTHPWDKAVLRPPTSAHQRMETWRQLQPFPDLWTVVVSLSPRLQLEIQRVEDGRYRVEMANTDAR